MEDFVHNFRKYLREKKLVRWITFTYPKSVATFGVVTVCSYTYVIMKLVKKEQKTNSDFLYAIYADDNVTRQAKNAVIYGNSNASTK